MAIYHLTPPVRGGERPRLPSTQTGPVTQAIRTMRAAEPAKTENVSVLPATDAAIAAIREGVMRFLAERIERDIALLDALDGDTDLEADFAHACLGSDGTVYTIGRSSDDEGHADDNGLGDYDALSEQGFPGYGRCA